MKTSLLPLTSLLALLTGCGIAAAETVSLASAGSGISSAPPPPHVRDLPSPPSEEDITFGVPGGSDCASSRRPKDGGTRLPGGITLVELKSCTATTRRIPGKGEWLVEQTTHTTSGLDELAEALRRPDAPHPPAKVACDAMAYHVPAFKVRDADGRTYAPRLPAGICSPQRAAMDALDAALARGRVTERVVKQIATEEDFRRAVHEEGAG